MKILALDTTALSRSAALVDEGRVQALVGVTAQRGSSEHVLSLVDQALALAGVGLVDLDAVCVSRGPGSLTGLRVGIGTARGIAIGAKLPLIGISSLRAIAVPAGDGPPVLSVIGAGRGEIYGCLFEPGAVPRPLGPERVARPEDFAEAVGNRKIRVAGPGASRYREVMHLPDTRPTAGEELLAGSVGLLAWSHLASFRSGGPGLRRDEGPQDLPDPGRAGPTRQEAVAGVPLSGVDRDPDTDASPRYLRREQGPIRFEG